MGDRVYAAIELGGHIETVEQCEELVEALAVEYCKWQDNNAQHPISSKPAAQQALRYFIENRLPPEFFDEQCNYGVFEHIEAAVEEIPGLGCVTRFDAGGGFGSGAKTILPDNSDHHTGYSDGCAMLSLTALRTARKEDAPLAAIDRLIQAHAVASGETLPSFTVSHAVAAYLKIFAQKVA